MDINEYKLIRASIDELLSLIAHNYQSIEMNLRMFDSLIKHASYEALDLLLLSNSLSHCCYSIEHLRQLDSKVRSLLADLDGGSYD